MANIDKRISLLVAALRQHGACAEDIADAVRNVRAVIAERCAVPRAAGEKADPDVFALLRTMAFLRDCLGRKVSSSRAARIIREGLAEIEGCLGPQRCLDSHFADDQALLKHLWYKNQDRLASATRLADEALRRARQMALIKERSRILHLLLKVSEALPVQCVCSPVPTPDLVQALHTLQDTSVAAMVEEELATCLPVAYDLLSALYGEPATSRLQRLLDLKAMRSEGYAQSIVRNAGALAELTDNLGIASRACGMRYYRQMTRSWDRLDKLRLIALLDLHDSGVNLCGYHLAFPVEYGSPQMPPWIGSDGIGQICPAGPGDAGYYVLLGDLANNVASSPEARQQLRTQYLNIRDNLIKPNYDALQLMVTHAQGMTRSTATSIIALLAKMLEAYRQVAYPADADAATVLYDRLVDELSDAWAHLSPQDPLPKALRRKITELTESADAEPRSVHALIRFLHECGNRALEQRLTTARADLRVTLGRIGGEHSEELRIARLDDAPLIVDGLLQHRGLAAIVRAAQWLAGPCGGTFVLVDNRIIYSVTLGEHRVELFANIADPDDEGLIRLQSFQGGAELAQALRAEFVGAVIREAGLHVSMDRSSFVEILVTGHLDKERGATSSRQIEQALVVVLRLIWALRDLDYAMAYLFLSSNLASASADKTRAEKISEFAASLARLFMVEGRIPFAYRGDGGSFEAYCEFSGPLALTEYRSYVSEERQMVRHRLYFAINALLRELDMPPIASGGGGVGQDVIDARFNGPCRRALARGELRRDERGRLQRNPAYRPLQEIIRRVLARERDALLTAVLLKDAGLQADFETIGSIDQLKVGRAQHETAPNEWLVIYSLSDEQSGAIVYAFAQHLKQATNGSWLSVAGLKKLLRKNGRVVPARIRLPAFRGLISHRLLVEKSRAFAGFSKQSVRGLVASLGDGSVRVGRVTLDRDYHTDPQQRSGRILLLPFTTPEDVEAIRHAEAVLVTSGGLLSHAGVTTREFGVPSLIFAGAEWLQTPTGTVVRIEARRPARSSMTDEGFAISESMIAETIEIREGCAVMVWASQGVASLLPITGDLLEPLLCLIRRVIAGERTAADLEAWLTTAPVAEDERAAFAQAVGDSLVLVLAEALWNQQISATVRNQLLAVVRRTNRRLQSGAAGTGKPRASESDAPTDNLSALIRTVCDNALAELEAQLAEVEHSMTTVTVLWRALNAIALVERLVEQVGALVENLELDEARLQPLQARVRHLRQHPRLALLKAEALHEVEALARCSLVESDLPAMRQALRRLGQRAAIVKPVQVLLVCVANVDRSPLAEYLLNKMLVADEIAGIQVQSRGVAAVDGRPMSDGSQAILLFEDDIIASAHRSRRLTAGDLAAADLVLTMERAQVDAIRAQYPDAAGKVFLLSHYARTSDFVDVEDPAGLLGDAYYIMKRQVQEALNGALRRMREEGLVARGMFAHLQQKADMLTREKRQRLALQGRSILTLDEVDADCVELVGGKGANLGEIAQIVKRHGASIPPALMVTTSAFDRYLEENGLHERYAQLTQALMQTLARTDGAEKDKRQCIADTSERVRKLLRGGRLEATSGLGREIMAAVDACGLRHRSLSVRSSGLQEDSEEAAFAGAAETYLFVDADQVLERVKDVWTSFWLARGILYRSDRAVRQGAIKLAVVVQQMFDSEVSGVMFTTDPVSGRDVIVIEAGYGLGEGVVSGVVDVDRYYVDKADGSVLSVAIGHKAFQVKPHASGKGTAIVPVDSRLRNLPCLAKSDVRANIAVALEDHYALSQDIEFGIAHGRFCILQTRPVTTRGQAPAAPVA